GYATPTLHQAALDALFAHGAFDLHVDRLRIEAPARLDAFRRGIASDVHADALAFTGTIELDGFAAEQVLLPRCQAAGFGVMGLSRYDDSRGGLVVGFAGAPAARIETEAARLGALLRGARC
ncbi:MAG: hypothetical protein JWM77_3293, partial [Rhodospirillales bacterium]|nr:hypothetical protein [Rhodospirillales bacterium]